jgi:hypothetical protein
MVRRADDALWAQWGSHHIVSPPSKNGVMMVRSPAKGARVYGRHCRRGIARGAPQGKGSHVRATMKPGFNCHRHPVSLLKVAREYLGDRPIRACGFSRDPSCKNCMVTPVVAEMTTPLGRRDADVPDRRRGVQSARRPSYGTSPLSGMALAHQQVEASCDEHKRLGSGRITSTGLGRERAVGGRLRQGGSM